VSHKHNGQQLPEVDQASLHRALNRFNFEASIGEQASREALGNCVSVAMLSLQDQHPVHLMFV
jgi:hypothetical protein